MKFKHGQYFFENEKGYFLFNSYLRRGRSFLVNGKVFDINFKTHPKLIRAIVERGECGPSPSKFNREEDKNLL